MIKELLIFAGGLAVGGLTGALITRHIMKKKCDEQINEEIAAFTKIRYEKKAPEQPKEEETKTTLDSEELAKKVSEAIKKNQAVNYNAYSVNGVQAPDDMITKPKKTIEEPDEKWPEEEEPDDKDEPDEWEVSEQENYLRGLRESENRDLHRHDGPKIIKAENYGEDGTLTTSTLLYYQDDDTLVDEETNEEIFDQNLTVGNALDKYGFRGNTEKIIYVRNYFLGYDYCIKKVFDSFVPIGNETR